MLWCNEVYDDVGSTVYFGRFYGEFYERDQTGVSCSEEAGNKNDSGVRSGGCFCESRVMLIRGDIEGAVKDDSHTV